ncbi:MAG: 2-amino-4-hydroxy-6-hydroxymethyldihydropteridine diphosphokinase [Anaeromyxobacteraceae bacterium]
MRAFIGVGSNLGDRWGNLALAGRGLRESGAVAVVRASSVWDTPPVGPPQPRYLNAVLEVETLLQPRPLLALLQELEGAAHRRRGGVRWAARTLDLDLLLYGERLIRDPGLVVPHEGIASRAFVLAPLAELAPALVVPGLGRTVAALLAEAPRGSIERVGLYPL